jgi:Holliday junction resolvase RusA-like endonuclease
MYLAFSRAGDAYYQYYNRAVGSILPVTNAITFSVAGRPRPKTRPRFVNGRVVSTVSKPELLWRGAVERAARECVANIGPLPEWAAAAAWVDMVFSMPTRNAKRVGLPHTVKPDKDNLEKLVLDAMEAAGLLSKGDARVSRGAVRKVWCLEGRGGVHVLLRPDGHPGSRADGAPAQLAGDDDDDDGVPGWLVGS